MPVNQWNARRLCARRRDFGIIAAMRILVCIKQVPGTASEVRAPVCGIKAAFDPRNILNSGKVVQR